MQPTTEMLDRLRGCGAVLFDLDDTLINTTEAYGIALRGKLGDLGLPATEDALHHAFFIISHMRSYNIKDAFIALLRESGMNPDEAWRKSEGLCESFNQLMLGCLKPLHGATEFLSHLEDKALKLGLVTNGYSDWQRKKLLISGLNRFFPPEHIAVSGELPRYCEKPAQSIYRQILDRLSISHYRVAFVGDRATDILGANVAGMISIMVGTGRIPGYDKGFPLECPDLWVDNLTELQEIWSAL